MPFRPDHFLRPCKAAYVDDLGNISNLLTEVLKRLERTEAKLESVEHKLESSTSLSSSSCSEKKREVPQIVKVLLRFSSVFVMVVVNAERNT